MQKKGNKWKYVWEIGGVCVLLFSVWINIFPADRVIMGGDIVQTLYLHENFAREFFEWFGRFGLFYVPVYILDLLHISESARLSWYLGFFLIGSYGSFLLFARLLFQNAPRFLTVAMSLFYACNLYTLFVFTETWGFYQYQALYIFIPALTALYIRSIQSSNKKYILGFSFTAFFASMGFGNPAFAVSTGIYVVLLTALLFLFRVASWNRQTIRKMAIIFILGMLVNAYWVLPAIPQMRQGSQVVATSTDIRLEDWLRDTSNSFFDTFRMVQTFEKERLYPYNFPYPEAAWLEDAVATLAFIPFFLIIFGLWRVRQKKVLTRWYTLFFVLFVVFSALAARARFPFDIFNSFLFQLPVMNAMRGYDKTAIFIPFIISALLLLYFTSFRGSRYMKIYVGTFCVVGVLLALPFFAGGLQTRMSYIMQHHKSKEYTSAPYSALVRIPDPYHEVRDIFLADSEDGKIAALPFSPGTAPGRMDLPGIQFDAPHFARYLYNGRPYFPIHGAYIPGWKFAEEFYEERYNPEWITSMYGLMGVKYVFFHKDAKPNRVENMRSSIRYLEGRRMMRLLEENQWFCLYQISPEYIFPQVYTSATSIAVHAGDARAHKTIAAFGENMTPIKSRKRNSWFFRSEGADIQEGAFVFLNEKPNTLWRAVYEFSDGSRVFLDREESLLANVWSAPQNLSGGTLEMYHYSLKWLYRGVWVTGMSLAILMVWGSLVLFYRQKEK